MSSNASSICHRVHTWAIALLVLHLLSAWQHSWALDDQLATDRYLSQQWSSNQFFDGAPITALAQTPDGYLWIGTWKGLYRFDGATFERMNGLDAGQPSVTAVLGLAIDAQGSLLVRSQTTRLLRFREARFVDVLHSTPNVKGITAMSVEPSGGVLVSTLGRGMYELIDGRLHPLQPQDVGLILSTAETKDGRIWLGTRENGLFYIEKGRTHEFEKTLPDKKINCLLPTEAGGLWIGTDDGLSLWDGEHVVNSAVSLALRHTQIFTLLQDRDANVWVATEKGVLRLNANGAMKMPGEPADAGSAATALLEDREGDLWVGDARGLRRFRNGIFTTYRVTNTPSPSRENAIFSDADSRVWLGPAAGGLYTLGDGKTQRVKISGLDRDVIYSMDGTEDLWLGRQHGGLTHLRKGHDVLTTETFTKKDGLAQNNIYAVRLVSDNGVWAASLTGGVSHFKDGVFTTYTVEQGLAANSVSAIEEGRDHTMWFGTSNGLSALSQGRWHTYRLGDGLPSVDITCLTLDDDGVLWIGTEGGLTAMSEGMMRAAPTQAAFLHEPIRGIAEGKDKKLWLATSRHVFSISRQAFMSGTWTASDLQNFDYEDGLLTTEGVRRSRSVVRDPRGLLWFSLNREIAVMDPSRARFASAPSTTLITSVLVDNQAQPSKRSLTISAAHKRFTFRYTGISLATPERVRYRYRLEGFDHQWSAPATAREATYTNLEPGSYTFQVQSSKIDSVWTGSIDELPFQIKPTVWQEWPFRLACLCATLLCMVALYRIRLAHLLKQANARFEERLAERTRIAQELHDTLLQGVFSASLQLHIVTDQVSEGSPAKPHLVRLLHLLERVTSEARDALGGLRTGSMDEDSLERVFSEMPLEIASAPEISYRVLVEGTPRSVHPAIQHEASRIGREALANAYRHARGRNIEVKVRYSDHQLSIMVHDDGRGIDSRILHEGRPYHWGLLGMRERAERLGAKLHLSSSSSAGTDVLLVIPGQIAYADGPHNRISRWLHPIARLGLVRQQIGKNGFSKKHSPHP